MAALAAHPKVTRAGAFGWSRGAEKLALLASTLANTDPLAAIALHAGSDIVHSAFDPQAFRTGQGGLDADPGSEAAWTRSGRPVPPGQPIEIERYPGPVFLSVGDADEVWDHRQTLRLADRLSKAGRPADLWEAEGQGHGLTLDVEPELWARLTAFFTQHLS
ncbi:MAG: prolyl oligopeptidase family serine peptidase [Rhodobacter sp.]|nr:prolyl oligopeptidase family serine peptidase [Rhodobacter sp.]